MDMPFDQMSQASDEALLVLYANGDPDAAAALTRRLTPMVFSLAQRLLHDRAEAEDVTQDAMLKLWHAAPDWRQGDAKVSTWLYRVARNLCIDRLRRRRSVGLDEIAEPEDDRPGVEAGMQSASRAAALHRALAELPDRQREAVMLRHLEGLGNPEIGAEMDISVEAVESLLARGKRRLTALLMGRRDELGLER
ncbi:MAG: RNA polymerase sigma factor [Rhodobacteraceae bacterium]|nr:RNA polymerase sigma factor [Paracoccaceae bacterium]